MTFAEPSLAPDPWELLLTRAFSGLMDMLSARGEPARGLPSHPPRACLRFHFVFKLLFRVLDD